MKSLSQQRTQLGKVGVKDFRTSGRGNTGGHLLHGAFRSQTVQIASDIHPPPGNELVARIKHSSGGRGHVVVERHL